MTDSISATNERKSVSSIRALSNAGTSDTVQRFVRSSGSGADRAFFPPVPVVYG